VQTRKKELVAGGVVIAAALLFLIINATRSSAQYFLTVEEVLASGTNTTDRVYRTSGAVVGDSILYDAESLTLHFTIAHVPASMDEVEKLGGLAAVLKEAVNNPANTRLDVVYNGSVPDLLRDEAQAIVSGYLQEDGTFHAEELLLKCPSKYESDLPAD
jgi:cytochrome c-type biogenesis protein CcmE